MLLNHETKWPTAHTLSDTKIVSEHLQSLYCHVDIVFYEKESEKVLVDWKWEE